MELILKRSLFLQDRTIGELFINGEKFCDTLEDRYRLLTSEMTKEEILKLKVKGQTAIPTGKYDVVLNFSARFGKMMPMLIDVKGFLGIRIHNGSFPVDTEGCILVGIKTNEMLTNSKITFKALMDKINALPKGEKITISIT